MEQGTLGEKEKATYQKQISELEAKDQDGLKAGTGPGRPGFEGQNT